MLFQQAVDTAAPAGSGFATDAGINHPAVGALLQQAFFEQRHPSLLLIDAVGGA